MSKIAQKIDILHKTGKTVFLTNELAVFWGIENKKILYVNIARMKEQGFLISIQRGLYMINGVDVNEFELAVRLKKNSYISLKTVLSKEGIIHQWYGTYSLISDRKFKVKNKYGDFLYRRMSSRILNNRLGIKNTNFSFIATKERAVCDYFYKFGFQQLDDISSIDKDKLSEISKIYNSIRLEKNIKKLINLITMKKALITGITGQDGSYLAELLLEKGYQVHGIKRRSSSLNTDRIDHLYQNPHKKNRNFILHYGDLTDSTNIIRLIKKIEPDEIYNLGAQSHVQVSFDTAEYTANSDALGVLRVLEAVRLLDMTEKVKIYQASTSELFGKVQEIPQKETTPFYPRSPYGVAKLYAYWIIKNYREAYSMFACNGILFNHESPRRGETFVTKKITRAITRISYGLQDKLYLGNLNARRDWGHAKDYVEAMYLMLQQNKPEDYVISTGKDYSVREFCEVTCQKAGISLKWEGEGINEKGINTENNKVIIEVDKKYFRPTEVNELLGDNTKAKNDLGWSPKISFEEMVEEMVESDLKDAEREVKNN